MPVANRLARSGTECDVLFASSSCDLKCTVTVFVTLVAGCRKARGAVQTFLDPGFKKANRKAVDSP